MKKYFKNEFMSTCKKDIEKICSQVEGFLPDVKDWQLDGSVILCNDKKIICKNITDDNGEKIGYEINVLFLSCNRTYTFVSTESSVTLESHTFENDIHLIEKEEVTLQNNMVIRSKSVLNGETELYFKDVYDLNTGYRNSISNFMYPDNYDKSLNQVFDEMTDVIEEKRTMTRRRMLKL